jgi:hypothetical protein
MSIPTIKGALPLFSNKSGKIMTLFKRKTLVILGLLMLPMLGWTQDTLMQQNSSNKQQKMGNRTVIGNVSVPKSSLGEFRKQNVTGSFLKTLPGFIKGEAYEKLDDSGNLKLVTVTTWLNEESYENADKALQEHYKSINFDPITYRERLKIVSEHGVYSMHGN